MKILNKKCENYNQQDIRKGRLRFDQKYKCLTAPILTVSQVIKLIAEKGLNCHYCDTRTILRTHSKFKKNLFTLDRIDNFKTHRIDNCVICCYQCNITRSDAFTSEEFNKIKKRK